MKKVVIIGSGLGGLTCGVILAKNGYDVTILEQATQLGGCLQCFTRHGVRFETGMHFIGSVDKDQTLERFARYLGTSERVRLSRLDPKGYDVVSLQGQQFRFANGKEAFIEEMAASFPKERENLHRYFNLVEQVANASSLHSLRHAENDQALNTEFQLRSINEVLDEVIGDPLLRQVLVGNLPLYAAEKDKTPFSTHAFIMDFYNQSAFRIIGGSDSMAKALAESLKEKGGRVITRQRVTEIVCDETKAVGVRTATGDYYPADIVISDTHPARTLEMVTSPLLRPAYRHRITSLRNTIGGFSVYLHFKPDTVPYMNYNYYGYSQSSPWNCEHYDEQSWPKGYLYMHFCHQENPRFAESGVILSYMHYDEVMRWEGTKVGHRGDDYEQFKQQKAEKLLDVVERDFPGLRGKIAHIYTSTPLTYRDYTGTEQGSMYGIAKDITMGPAARVHHRTKIPNLLLTGQNVNSHGVLGVIVGTVVTCSELIGSETIFNQIKACNE